VILAFLTLLWGCGPKVYTPPTTAVVQVGQAQATGDKWGVLEQANTLIEVSIRQRSTSLMVRYWPEPAGGEWGKRGIFDPSPYVQRRTIEALQTRLHESESRLILIDFLKNEQADPFTRGKAALALAKNGQTEILGQLQDSLAVPRHLSYQAPLALAASILGDSSAQDLLLLALKQGDFPLEIDFFIDCGSLTINGLSQALSDGLPLLEEELHLPVARSLILLGSKKGVDIFQKAFRSDNVELQHEALDLLWDLKHPQVISLLKKAKKSGASSTASHARLILASHDTSLPDTALKAIKSNDREQRSLGIRCLREWKRRHPESAKTDKRLQQVAILSLSDLEAVVQQEALQLLGSAGKKTSFRHLTPFLSSEDPRLRVEAAGAILQIEARIKAEN
jgi:HEAT repeat protein